jgi:aminopeptidase YwaD
MKKQIYSFLILLSFVFSISAQKTSETEANLRKHVGYLASDALEGRRTGESGATSAAGYVTNMFANYKLKGGVSQTKNGKISSNFLQPFPYIAGVSIADSGNTFTLDVAKNDGQKMTFDDKPGFKPIGSSPNGQVSDREVVFAGYGIVSEEQKYDDYKNLDVRNKVVIAYNGNSNSRFDAYTKAKIAKDKGAVGLLLISRESDIEKDKLAALKYDQASGETAVPTLLISRKTAADLFGTTETKVVEIEKILSSNTDAAIRIIVEINSKAIVGFKVNLIKKETETYNVIGILEGNDAQLKNEAIIIGAHYDHLGKGGQGSLAVNSTEIHYGADDNASGVSAMLELARQFAKEKKNKRTLIFIAFGGEEEGLLGSKFYVNNPIFPLNKTVAMINMDMVGRLKDDKLTVGGIGTANEWKSLVESKNEIIPKVYGDSKKATSSNAFAEKRESVYRFSLQLNEDGFGPSDHSSFYGKQIPVLFFFTGTHEDYHKPSDTADKINYGGLLKITEYVADITRYIDQSSTKPTYKVAQSSGTGGGRMSFNVSLGTVPAYGDSTDGMLIDAVRDNSPAAKSGLKAGDKIVELAGKDVRNVQDYTIILGELKADTEYEIVVMRGAEKLTLKIIPAARK